MLERCGKRPGIDYFVFSDLGPRALLAQDSRLCHQCFPSNLGQARNAPGRAEAAESDSDDSSSSSSSAVTEVGAAPSSREGSKYGCQEGPAEEALRTAGAGATAQLARCVAPWRDWRRERTVFGSEMSSDLVSSGHFLKGYICRKDTFSADSSSMARMVSSASVIYALPASVTGSDVSMAILVQSVLVFVVTPLSPFLRFFIPCQLSKVPSARHRGTVHVGRARSVRDPAGLHRFALA